MASKTKMPDHVKRDLTAWAEAFMEERFEPGINKEGAEAHGFNYVVDLYARWRGPRFYIGATYRRAGFPDDAGDEAHFDAHSARVTYQGPRSFALAYMRHTKRWHTVFYDLTLEQVKDRIEGMEIFWPMH
jgi:hypothetical protein